MKKKFQKNSSLNQRFMKKVKKFFKKHLEVMKKYLPLHSQSKTKGLPKKGIKGKQVL
jgi:hypothetical protein